MEVIAQRAAATGAVAMLQGGGGGGGGGSCSHECDRSSKSIASSALTRVRVCCASSSLSRRCSKLARSQSFGEMQAFGDPSSREVIEQSAMRRSREAFRSSRPTAAIHASYGVATQLKDSINRDSSAFHLDRSGNSSTGCVTSSMQLDGWVEDAVFEIVKKVDEAPFLQFVFETQNISERPKWQRVSQDLFQKPELWPELRDSLSEAAPDGVILVHRLDVTGCCLMDPTALRNDKGWKCPLELDGSNTDVWGVLVQARSAHANACYILKTTRVCSSTGVCTQFCLTRAKCFGPSFAAQLEKVWLL
ncbi:hypothetical protein CY35_03G092200 [Sphagnum magellanicum]|nr:hypothetical protein CY35_03G092200 [Sphagnum magellanicum]